MKSVTKFLIGGIAVVSVALAVMAWNDPANNFNLFSSGIGSRTYVYQTVNDTVTNSATLKNSELSFSLAANQSVHVRYSLPFRMTSGVNPWPPSGVKFQITAPSGFVHYSSACVIYSVSDSVAFVQVAVTPGNQGLVGLPTGSNIAAIDLDITNGSNAGNVTLQFAQNVATVGENTILLRGAYGEITKR